MRIIVIVLFTIHLSLFTFCQDSVRLEVTRVKHTEDRFVYWLRDVDTKDRYITQCNCKSKRVKGEIVMIARKDLVIEKEIFRRKDLEN